MQGGWLPRRQSVSLIRHEPVPLSARVRQDFELYVLLVRLNLWEKNLGQPTLRWLPRGNDGSLSSGGTNFFEGEIRNAF